MTRLSVQLYSVRDQFAADPLATLQRLAGIGFTDVEPYGLVQHLDALRDGLPQTPLSAPPPTSPWSAPTWTPSSRRRSPVASAS